MELRYVTIAGFLLVLLAVDCCCAADPEVKAPPNTKSDVDRLDNKNNLKEKTNGSNPVLDSSKENRDQVTKSKEGVKNDLVKSNPSEHLGSKEGENADTDKGSSNGGLPVKEVKTKEKPDGAVEPKKNTREESNEGTSVNLVPPRKENSRGEECDISNRCSIEEDKLVACLRVPGNESPDLSLLIQNKGKVSLTVKISAPDYVLLEKTKIQLQQKEDKKVKVSIKNSGTYKPIVLTTAHRSCSLNFRDLIAHNSMKETDTALKSKYIILLHRTPSVAFISLAALLILASALAFARFKRRHSSSSDSKYQKLDMELPVAGGGKSESDENEGWDNSWDDNWDDEEAPKTPSMPVTPSLSSKGLASRRSNKEGWKD